MRGCDPGVKNKKDNRGYIKRPSGTPIFPCCSEQHPGERRREREREREEREKKGGNI
jgi:hypothetical protein